MKVDFIIVGGQKCGTTALHYFLSKHPKIIESNPKEIDFFNYDNNYNKGVNYYHSFFNKKPILYNLRGYKFLEASPSYINGNLFTDTSKTAKRIFDYNPNVKIICLVRNPIDRAYSAWNMFRRYNKGDENWWFKWFEERIGESPNAIKRKEKSFEDFDYFIKEELECIGNRDVIECPVLINGNYATYLVEFKKVFKNNFLVVENEKLELNTISELNLITEFLNLPIMNWDLAKNKKVFKGNYIAQIKDETKEVLQSFYVEANQDLLNLTGIDYNK